MKKNNLKNKNEIKGFLFVAAPLSSPNIMAPRRSEQRHTPERQSVQSHLC
jgi:hypothetical protein